MRSTTIRFAQRHSGAPYSLLAYAAVLLVSTTAYAQQPKLASRQGDFKEALNTDVVVSGGVIVGVDGDSPVNAARLKNLVIRPGSTVASRELCLRVVS